jgi:hypothetical protein
MPQKYCLFLYLQIFLCIFLFFFRPDKPILCVSCSYVCNFFIFSAFCSFLTLRRRKFCRIFRFCRKIDGIFERNRPMPISYYEY